MNFKQITYQTTAYYQVVQLRERILRIPLGLKFSESDLALDKDEMLFALFKHYEPVACLQVRKINDRQVKLRQMAVDQNYQKQGLGKTLMQKVENHLKKLDIKSIELNARQTAIGFYQKLGYRIVSGKFIEVGISHYKMMKNL